MLLTYLYDNYCLKHEKAIGIKWEARSVTVGLNSTMTSHLNDIPFYWADE